MSLLLNSAGVSAADPILNGLGMQWIIDVTTMDAATNSGVWIDTAAGFPGTNAATVHPTIGTVLAGNSGSVDTGGTFTIASTTGLAAGDYIYLSHPSAPAITAGHYKIATVPTGTTFTLTSNPFAGSAASGISYQASWTADLTAGSSPTTSSGGGTQNFYKADIADSAGNHAQQSDTNYIEDAPALSGTTYLSAAGKALDGTQSTNTTTPAATVLSGWTNHGGVAIVSFTAHSVQTTHTDFQHSDGSTTEKSLATFLSNGFKLVVANGINYGRIQLKSAASGVIVGQDIQITTDTTPPTVAFTLIGR